MYDKILTISWCYHAAKKEWYFTFKLILCIKPCAYKYHSMSGELGNNKPRNDLYQTQINKQYTNCTKNHLIFCDISIYSNTYLSYSNYSKFLNKRNNCVKKTKTLNDVKDKSITSVKITGV